jgi:hypothetical protein
VGTICWTASSLLNAETFPAAATRTSDSESLRSRTNAGASSDLEVKATNEIGFQNKRNCVVQHRTRTS